MIATMVRDDDDYINEWVEYHLAIGFEHILIYDHKSINPVIPIWEDKVTVKRIEKELPFAEYIYTYQLLETLNHIGLWLLTLMSFLYYFSIKT